MCELVPKRLIPPCIRSLTKTRVGTGMKGREIKSEKAALVPGPTAMRFEAFISSKILAAVLPQTGMRNASVTDLGYTHRP